MTDDNHLGRMLKRRRDELGLSMSRLSDLSGVAKSHICQIEHDNSQPSVRLLRQLARVLQVSVDSLLSGIETDPTQADRVNSILAERAFQEQKWGEHNRGLDVFGRCCVLTEELGEVVRAANDSDLVQMRRECVHVAAVALAIMEWIDGQASEHRAG